MLDVRVLWSEADASARSDRLLTGAEQARLRGLTRAADQDLFRSAHVLARVLVAQILEVDTASVRLSQRCSRCGGPHGRPVAGIPGRASVEVSLSHAGGVVVAAASRAEIGVDHEPLGAARPSVAAVALTANERALLADRPAVDQPNALLRWWVRKEAVLKMTGYGLLVDPSHLEISAPDEPPRLLAWHGPGSRPTVELADLDLDGFVAALAVRTNQPLRVVLGRAALSEVGW